MPKEGVDDFLVQAAWLPGDSDELRDNLGLTRPANRYAGQTAS